MDWRASRRTWWDDLYTNIPGGSDAWFSTNVSTAVTSGETADFVVIFDKDKKPFRAWHASGGEKESDVGFASAEFVRQIEVLLHDNPKASFQPSAGSSALQMVPT